MAITRTTVRLEEGLLREAKKLAAETGRTLTSLIEDALREVVSRRAAPSAPRAEPELPTWGGGGLKPGYSWDRLKDVLEEEDIEKYRR